MTTLLHRTAVLAMLMTACLLTAASAFAQSTPQPDPDKYWQLLDREQDHVNGTSVNKAYQQLLKGRKSHPIIVAVIDVGVDTAHEDLQGHLWRNPKEIPGNGIDDDGNGYIDDVYGWNFLGSKDGRNIVTESLEYDREYYRLRPQYANIMDSAAASANHLQEYAYWCRTRDARAKDSARNYQQMTGLSGLIRQFSNTDSLLKAYTKKDTLFYSTIDAVPTSDSAITSTRTAGLAIFNRFNVGHDISLEAFIALGNEYLATLHTYLNRLAIDPNAQRREIIGDDPNNMQDTKYGNNDVFEPTESHGTHVSGIIAAIRGNGIGMDGITDNVKIMVLRAGCEGDERDKDVALAIRYAVDNGARVINMSFGKPLSPGKAWVDDAVAYAEKKNVLLVHGAGNDFTNSDSLIFYPTAYLLKDARRAGNFITVGASSNGPDSLLAASFSNYGAKEVDLFAPGTAIYSTIPGNKYESESGTSMATPVVAGIAALVLEYFPSLTAAQLKAVLMSSVTKFPGLRVRVPGSRNKAEFATLSVSGGIVNAYGALEMAAKLQAWAK
jgi:cell wall-associated protease